MGVDQAYGLIAERLGLSGFYDSQVTVFQQVSEWLSNAENGTWLMVLDNADDEETFFDHNSQEGSRGARKTLSDYIPKSPGGFVIITTRDMRVGMRLTNGGEPIAVPRLVAQEAGHLLRSKLPQYQDKDGVDTAELLNTLDYLPLAITHAAAYIRENQIEPAEYTRILRKGDSDMTELLSEEIRDPWRDNATPTSIFQTWELSFGQIRKQKPRAAELLSLMAVLDRNEIPKSLLLGTDEGEGKFNAALGPLKAFYLITTGKGGNTFTMHRLVQLATQNWLKNHEETTRYQEEAVKLLSERFPSGEYATWQLCQALSPHAQVVLEYSYEPPSSLLHAKLLYKVAWYEWKQGRYSIARSHSERAHDVRQKYLGGDDPQTLSSLALLAVVLKDLGEFKAAEAMHRKVLKRQEKVLGKEHQDTLRSVSDLAVTLRSLGKYNDAETMHRRALEGRQKVLGDGNSETLTSITDLAMVLVDQGKYKIGEKMHRQALERKWSVLGKEDPDTLASMESLAGVLEMQEKYEEAEQMYHDVLVLYRKALGEEHPDTLSCMNNLAGLYSKRGRLDTAEEMYRRALELYEKILGKEHPYTLASMSNLALVLEDQGRYDDAERMQRETLERSEKVLGKEHPDTLANMNNLACLLNGQGKYDEAEKMHRQVLRLSEEVLGEMHLDTLRSMEHLADVLRNQNKHDAAKEIDDRVRKRRERLEERAEDVENPKETLWDLGLAFVGYWKGMFRKRDRR
jgi:tetratricopeptide (TPR) repeat protein